MSETRSNSLKTTIITADLPTYPSGKEELVNQQADQPSAKPVTAKTQPGMPMEILGMYLFIASELIAFITLLFILFWLRSGLVGDWPLRISPVCPSGSRA